MDLCERSNLKLQFGEAPGRSRTNVTVAPTITDNRGNVSALNKLMTTTFSASALLMELSCCMKKMSIRTAVHWTPREGNKEVDRLANGVFGGRSHVADPGQCRQPAVGNSSARHSLLGKQPRSRSRMPSREVSCQTGQPEHDGSFCVEWESPTLSRATIPSYLVLVSPRLSRASFLCALESLFPPLPLRLLRLLTSFFW